MMMEEGVRVMIVIIDDGKMEEEERVMEGKEKRVERESGPFR